MRIIKHGDKYELGEITCDRCGCTFAYTASDIRHEVVADFSDPNFDKDWIEQTVINCPECKKRLKI
jgi:hypothetical protein